MSSAYPASLDAFSTSHASGQTITAATVNDLADAINKIEAELGIAPSGGYATLLARLKGPWPDIIADYGADPTGASTCGSVVQTALNDLDTAGGGVVIAPHGAFNCTGTELIIPDTCLLWGPGGPLGTRLFWTTDLGAGHYAVTTEDIGNNTEREPAIIGIQLDGPGNEGVALGSAPCNMHGIKLNSNGLAQNCWGHGWNRGVEWYGNHQRTFECRFNSNYDGGYFGAGNTFGDQDIRGTRFVGNKRASWGVDGAGMADGITSVGNHLGFSPYCIYKEAGTRQEILTNSTMTDSPFEAVGNSAIYDAGGDGIVQSVSFMNGAGGGGWWDSNYKIAANPADYYVVCYSFNNNHVFGQGWFCKAGAVGVFDCGGLNNVVFHDATTIISNVVADSKRFVSDATACYGVLLVGDRGRKCKLMKYGGGAGTAARYDVLYAQTSMGGPGLGCGKQGSSLPVGVAQWAVPSDNYWVAVCVEGETDVNCSQGQSSGTWYAQADTGNRGKASLGSDATVARIIGYAESGTTNGTAHIYMTWMKG